MKGEEGVSKRSSKAETRICVISVSRILPEGICHSLVSLLTRSPKQVKVDYVPFLSKCVRSPEVRNPEWQRDTRLFTAESGHGGQKQT